MSGADQFPDEIGSGGGEELEPDLEHAHAVVERLDQAPGGVGGGDVEWENDFVFRRRVHRMTG